MKTFRPSTKNGHIQRNRQENEKRRYEMKEQKKKRHKEKNIVKVQPVI